MGIDSRLGYTGEKGYRAAAVHGDKLQLRIFVDRGSIEVFANGGTTTLTSFSFPDEGPRAIELCSENGIATISGLRVHTLRTIWED